MDRGVFDTRLRFELAFRDALGLYIFLSGHEESMDASSASFLAMLRAFLYEHLSIEDMERPEELLSRLD